MIIGSAVGSVFFVTFMVVGVRRFSRDGRLQALRDAMQDNDVNNNSAYMIPGSINQQIYMLPDEDEDRELLQISALEPKPVALTEERLRDWDSLGSEGFGASQSPMLIKGAVGGLSRWTTLDHLEKKKSSTFSYGKDSTGESGSRFCRFCGLHLSRGRCSECDDTAYYTNYD